MENKILLAILKQPSFYIKESKTNLKAIVGLLVIESNPVKAEKLDCRLACHGLGRSQGQDVVVRPADDQRVDAVGQGALSSSIPDRSVVSEGVVLKKG